VIRQPGMNNKYSRIKKYKTRKREKGFTLIEVMVALSIITIALVTVLNLQSQGLSLAAEAKFNTNISLLARSKIAEIKSMDPEMLSSDYGDFGPDYPEFSWEVSVYDAVLDPPLDELEFLKQIEITVSWEGSEQPQYTHRFYRFIPEQQ